MTKTRIAFLTSACCVLAMSACNREDTESSDDMLRKGELPAEVSVRERVAAEERAEQQGVVAAKPESTPTEATNTEATRVQDTTNNTVAATNPTLRRAEADLDTVNGAELDAKAVFEERADGVAVLVNVEDAKPGTRSVRIYDRENCDDLNKKGLGKPLNAAVKHGNLGSVTIDANGTGTLEAKAPSSTLKPDDKASLLGKTIVVQERSDGDSPKAAGDAIACGVIRLDEGLADKAGRMTEPVR
jgi:Cu/Zn superoxide dismutase